ncbi:hypothetical protein GQS52_11380 [Streptomyces sp. SCUT-3]|uniref:hypothetical protein n=1 Tax=unclassified Streptomyces TaxID=2593676 RepID=UPI0015FC01EE|nr:MULTISPECIES: hypothetical protein [unclassified Streptomyces]MCZ2523848.1 hypothetical protein [Streptomyces sp. HB2AG]QMV22295.1 hypothetical protein GQS52_11380 [Streptomyces sp. SCUT-3]
MNFSVEPGNIESYGKLVKRAAEAMEAGESYLSKYAKVDESSSGEIWQKVVGLHGPRVQEALGVIKKFSKILTASSRELERSARYYRNTDRSQAERLDATYPEGSGVPAYSDPWTGSPSDFKDRTDAENRLKPPGGGDGYIQGHIDEFDFNPAMKTFGTLMDLTSPTALVAEGIKLAFGKDILGGMSQWVAGDWESYLDCADVWDNLASLCADVSENVTHGNYTLSSTWSGNSADVAWDYFDAISSKLDEAQIAFESLRDKYIEIASSIFGLAELVKAGAATLSDMAIQVAVTAAASSAAATTGVGLVGTALGAAVIAKRIFDMMDQYKKLLDAYDLALAGVSILYSAGSTSMAATESGLKSFPVPGGSYDNASV